MSLLPHSALAASLVLPLSLAGCGGGESGSGSSGNESSLEVKVTFQSAGQVIDEAIGIFTALVRLSAAAEEVVTVEIVLGAGTANAVDFELQTTEVTFAIGEILQPVVLVVFDDDDCEGQETIRLLLGAPTNAEIGATDRHDITITGSLLELEPNDDVNQALGNGPLATLGPGLVASLCGESTEVGNSDDFDVYMIDVAQDTDFTLNVFNADANADFILILAELAGVPFQVVDVNGAGGDESTVFSRLAGQSFMISISMVDPNGAGSPLSAEYEVLVVGAAPAPLAPPAGDDDQELAELLARGADWRTLVEHVAGRDEPLFARR